MSTDLLLKLKIAIKGEFLEGNLGENCAKQTWLMQLSKNDFIARVSRDEK